MKRSTAGIVNPMIQKFSLGALPECESINDNTQKMDSQVKGNRVERSCKTLEENSKKVNTNVIAEKSNKTIANEEKNLGKFNFKDTTEAGRYFRKNCNKLSEKDVEIFEKRGQVDQVTINEAKKDLGIKLKIDNDIDRETLENKVVKRLTVKEVILFDQIEFEIAVNEYNDNINMEQEKRYIEFDHEEALKINKELDANKDIEQVQIEEFTLEQAN